LHETCIVTGPREAESVRGHVILRCSHRSHLGLILNEEYKKSIVSHHSSRYYRSHDG